MTAAKKARKKAQKTAKRTQHAQMITLCAEEVNAWGADIEEDISYRMARYGMTLRDYLTLRTTEEVNDLAEYYGVTVDALHALAQRASSPSTLNGA